jgi:hypothetical protein
MGFEKTSFGRIFGSAENSGFPGVPPQRMACGPPEANPQDLRPFAQLRCPPGGHGVSQTPQGVSIIPMINTGATVFELVSFGYKHYIDGF